MNTERGADHLTLTNPQTETTPPRARITPGTLWGEKGGVIMKGARVPGWPGHRAPIADHAVQKPVARPPLQNPTRNIRGVAHVGILMAVLNGNRRLAEQLDSIAGQDHENWHLITSDDGSGDNSKHQLEKFAKKHPVTNLDGPRRGAAQNFMSLIRAAPKILKDGAWIAFADQDDVWLKDRLSRGLAALAKENSNVPALYCSRTWVVDDALQSPRLSHPHARGPAFQNALVQNIASGNTILLNPAAAKLICAAAHETGDLALHDWWVYQLVVGAGGRIIHDPTPTLLYRQHSQNTIGANLGARAFLRRVGLLVRGRFRDWNDLHVAALMASGHHLTDRNRALLEDFNALRNSGFFGRLRRLPQVGLFCQTRRSTLALWLVAAVGRL